MRNVKRMAATGAMAAAAFLGSSIAALPASAASTDTSCYTCQPPPTLTTDPGSSSLPFTLNTSTSSSNGSSSLPFTGADVEELALVGAGSVFVGVVLSRRRRKA